jgi:diguanylate cyclase (GGDEF)-like protein
MALAYAAFQHIYLPHVTEIDFYSVIAEGAIAITILILLFNLRSLQENKQIHFMMFLGFTMLFIGLWTDMLDELFEHPKLLTSVLEDLFVISGFIVVVVGINKWMQLNQQQRNKLLQLATTDSLTGLFVRRYFNEKANTEFTRCRRYKGVFSLLMIDIDNFKLINDKHGHSCGDTILSAFSKNLKENLRETEIVARWGGEEFIVLVPESSSELCAHLSEKLVKLSQNTKVLVGDEIISFTVSIGGVTLKDEDNSVEDLINRADQLLYKAKQEGRNQFFVDSALEST